MLNNYLTKLFGLEGKTALVIGGSGHLGREMVKGLTKTGVRVAIASDDQESLDKFESSTSCLAIKLDVREKGELEAALEQIQKEFGRLDILINAAGCNAPTSFLEISLEEWRSIIDVNLTGTMLSCQVFGSAMVKKKMGSIINISSVSAGPPLSKAFSYSVAKAGIKNLTQNLAREWAPYHVRVNTLRPGFFPTEWSMKNFIDKDREQAIFNHTPMKRYGKPSELVGAVLWLASDAASFVTGSEIIVDGGFMCKTI